MEVNTYVYFFSLALESGEVKSYFFFLKRDINSVNIKINHMSFTKDLKFPLWLPKTIKPED